MPQEKENEPPRIPGAFRPGDPIPEQPTMPGATGKTVDDEPDHDKAREQERVGESAQASATAVDPMKSTDLKGTDKPTETDRPGEKDKPDYHGKVRATRDDHHKSHR